MNEALPWSSTIRFRDLERGPVQRRLEADPAVRKAIARYLGLVSIEALEADLVASRWLDGAEIEGRFRAEVTQTCSVTAESFPDTVSGVFQVRVLPPGSPNAPQEDLGEEIDLDPEAEDPPDVLESEAIDLAAYVLEHLSLELDPFPRKPGAVYEPPADTDAESPFAVLRLLKKDQAPD